MPSDECLPRLPGVPEFATPERLMEHPRFGLATDMLVDGLADLYGNDTRLVRSLFEYDRAVLFMIAVGIDALQRGDPAAPPMSVATLTEAAALTGIGPARRVRRLVEEMREDQFLITEPLPGDRRRQRLRCSERMREIDRDWLATFHRPLLAAVPDNPRFQKGSARDPDYHQDYRFVSQQTLAFANQVMRENPPVDFFLHQVSGARVLAVLLQATRFAADGWTPTGFYSAAAIRTATSRVHVRSVLRNARDRGLVEISEEADGRVRVPAELRESFARFAAQSLVAIDLVSAFAMETARQRSGLSAPPPA